MCVYGGGGGVRVCVLYSFIYNKLLSFSYNSAKFELAVQFYKGTGVPQRQQINEKSGSDLRLSDDTDIKLYL